MPKLLHECSSNLYSTDFYDHITNQKINSYKKTKQVEKLQYLFWPVVNSGYQQKTDHKLTNEDQNKTIVHEQLLNSGRESMHLRTLFDATAIDQNLIQDLFEVQLPILLIRPLILLLVNLVVMATAAYLAAV